MSWIAEAIEQVRLSCNEPVSKWSDARVIHQLELALAVEMGFIFAQADGPNVVIWDLTVVPGVRDYARPPHVSSFLLVRKVDTLQNFQYGVAPRGRDSIFGPGIDFDNGQIRVSPDIQQGETFQVWYKHTGECRLATGPLAASTPTSLVLGAPTLGALDTRAMGYAGCTARITAVDGRIEDRHVSTSSFDGATHTLTVAPAVTIPLNGTYELVPAFGVLFMHAATLQATLSILAPDAPQARISRIADRLEAVRSQLRMNTQHLNGITGRTMRGDSWLARVRPLDGWRQRQY